MSAIHFLLNDSLVRTEVHPATLVLDYLRDHKQLKGTKEGCREGDCGACVALIGELDGHSVRYRPVTTCLVPIGSLHRRHLVTIEGLNVEGLSPVQEAIVDAGGSQCGFCTPGIVVSITGALIEQGGSIGADEMKEALGGHLCRCTGYRSLKESYRFLNRTVGGTSGLDQLADSGVIPLYFKDIHARLAALISMPATNGAVIAEQRIAGGTDLYVQRGDELPGMTVDVLDVNPDLLGIQSSGDYLDVGAATTFEDFSNDPSVQQLIPDIRAYMHLIASRQIRNRATLGGNVINASPIGDMTILLLALGTQLRLAGPDGERVVPITEFYKGYKQMDLMPGEVLVRLLIPRPYAGTRIRWEKVSKRKTLDIATVNFALAVAVEDGRIRHASLAVGGVAPVPLFLRKTSAALVGLEPSTESVRDAADVMLTEISPISDVRGSATYKRLLARNLMLAAFGEVFPELAVEELV